MSNFDYYLTLLNNEIENRINNNQSEPKQLYDPIRYILANGGKRLRVLFVLLGSHLFSNDLNDALPIALGIEVFHNFTLLHDDVMDKADIRRGKPTVHKKWNENAAILSGDAMMILAQKYISEAPEIVRTKATNMFLDTALEVCEGQQLDVNLESKILGKDTITEAEYIEMIRLKTSVLIAASLALGSIMGGANDKDTKHLYEYGETIGLAFQIQDDLLDTFGDEKTFGKRIGGDIIEGKKTYLLIKAFEKATDADKQILAELINNKNIPETEKIEKVKSVYEKLEIRKTTENEIEKYFDKADKILENVICNDEAKCALMQLVAKLRKRLS